MKFQPGNSFGKGRPRNARNRLAARVIQDLQDVWDEPVVEGKPLTRGKAALRVMSREDASGFAKLYGSLVPKECWVESNLADADDAELDRMIEELRNQIRTEEKEPADVSHLN